MNVADAIRRPDESTPEGRTVGARAHTGGSWAWAIRALRLELLGFRFVFPLEIVPEGRAANALHYHLRSDRLFLDDVEFDGNGVAVKRYRGLGRQYNPLFVAWWGLVNLERYLRQADDEGFRAFLSQVEWLRLTAVERRDGAVVWPCYFDWQEGRCRLRAPWISAMYQGVVISALVRAYRITGDRTLLSLCTRAARVFERSIEEGGVRTVENGKVLYEEYPGYPLARVLDGFLFSLLGLYDLAAETGDPGHRRLFGQGIEGLKETLPTWDYRGKWSWYGTHGYLCPPHYHNLNGVLLGILGNLTGEEVLHRYARRWNVNGLSLLDRCEIFMVFAMTKNWARLRLPRS